MQRKADTDVLIVGGGGAGFRAAIGACLQGLQVTLLSKGPLARCGATPMAGADFTLDGQSLSKFNGLEGDPNDNPQKMANDIITQGWFLNNQKLVEQYIERAPQCLEELINWGIKVKLSDERMVFTNALEITSSLYKKARSIGVKMLEDIFFLDLITEQGRVAGGIGLDIYCGELIHFKAKAVVIATGGWHKAFWPNTGMRDLSGDGIAMAYRAGAELGNMEFITFCNNVFFDPPIWKGSIAPYVLSLFIGGRLTNSLGENILEKYDPYIAEKGTFTEWNKSFISYATAKEVREGKGLPHGGINYCRGNAAWENVERAASMLFPKWKYRGMDLSEWGEKLKANEPVEVGPAVEYFDGGIVVNENFETGIEGLYAAGECTLGPFGANRVFSAITEMLVHGADAGNYAAQYAKNVKTPKIDKQKLTGLQEKIEAPLNRSQGLTVARVRKQIQQAAHQYLGPVRNKEELEKLVSLLIKVRKEEIPNLATTAKRRYYNKEWLEALELANMVQLLEIAATSALARTESRGVHYREDYPNTDNDKWLRESIITRAYNDFEINWRPVTVTSMRLPTGTAPYLDFMKKMMKAHSDTGGKH